MRVNGVHYRTIWLDDDQWSVRIIDQTLLPHRFETVRLSNLSEAARSISDMQVRGAPLIGATAAYGLCLGLREDPSDSGLEHAAGVLEKTTFSKAIYRQSAERVLQSNPLSHPVGLAVHDGSPYNDKPLEPGRFPLYDTALEWEPGRKM